MTKLNACRGTSFLDGQCYSRKLWNLGVAPQPCITRRNLPSWRYGSRLDNHKTRTALGQCFVMGLMPFIQSSIASLVLAHR
ncbi:hypothetical protein AN403_5949 [Pseudomonas fluorescens]|uniref:Uncharacterized protein n=1 Tax=Pseudomonas fluorescens TaxID=294 RepID=A0A0P9BFU5_PSEFL|nr:hypothetical protein AN403_5949 [Pseudomonas fluorescens]